MPIIESCRLMPWTREETQHSSTKEKEHRKWKLPFTEFLMVFTFQPFTEQGGGSGSGWLRSHLSCWFPIRTRILNTVLNYTIILKNINKNSSKNVLFLNCLIFYSPEKNTNLLQYISRFFGIKVDFKFYFKNCGIMNLRIRSGIRLQNVSESWLRIPIMNTYGSAALRQRKHPAFQFLHLLLSWGYSDFPKYWARNKDFT